MAYLANQFAHHLFWLTLSARSMINVHSLHFTAIFTLVYCYRWYQRICWIFSLSVYQRPKNVRSLFHARFLWRVCYCYCSIDFALFLAGCYEFIMMLNFIVDIYVFIVGLSSMAFEFSCAIITIMVWQVQTKFGVPERFNRNQNPAICIRN